MSVIRSKPALTGLLLAVVAGTAGCSGSGAATSAEKKPPAWQNGQVNAVSRTAVGAEVAATTSLRPDGTLETVTVDLTTGRKLWAYPATMRGRLPGMGVQAPAVVPTGDGEGVVAAIEPATSGGRGAALVARDARTGTRKWVRPVRSSFGPQRCGPYLCVSENTALSRARVVALDPAAGEPRWRMPGIAEVEWSDDRRVVLLRLAEHPTLEARDARTGKVLWSTPVEQALGPGVDLSGGWAFGSTGTDLVGYVAPYTNPETKTASTFGLFSVRLEDGHVNWIRPSVVRVYPSGSPGFAPVVRPVDEQGRYGGFALLDAESGRVLGQIGTQQIPGNGWWLAFPEKPSTLGFLKHNATGAAYDLATGRTADPKGLRGWSFCVTDPKPLRLANITPEGFYSVAALCEYDLGTGKRVSTGSATPPLWFTGSQDGWRLWRDEKGGLHAVRDGSGTTPGMYGLA